MWRRGVPGRIQGTGRSDRVGPLAFEEAVLCWISYDLASFCRETRKLLLRQGLTISRTIRPQTDFAGACESRSHKAVCAVRCPGWFVIGSIYRPQLMQEQI